MCVPWYGGLIKKKKKRYEFLWIFENIILYIISTVSTSQVKFMNSEDESRWENNVLFRKTQYSLKKKDKKKRITFIYNLLD